MTQSDLFRVWSGLAGGQTSARSYTASTFQVMPLLIGEQIWHTIEYYAFPCKICARSITIPDINVQI